MSDSETNIPQPAVEVLAKSFFRQSITYGFTKMDHLRFVNLLLEMAFEEEPGRSSCGKKERGSAVKSPIWPRTLPLRVGA